MFTSYPKLQNNAFHVVDVIRTTAKFTKMKNALAKSAKLCFSSLNMLITQRVKLLNADWSMERIFFSYFAREKSSISRSRLVLRLPSNNLCHREEIQPTVWIAFRDS